MKTRLLLILLTALAPAVAAAAPIDRTFRARLERGPCFGFCPSYTVDLTADGRVRFEGRPPGRGAANGCLGVLRWRVSRAAVARLQRTVDRGGFYGFKSEYAAPVTDLPTYTVTVTRRGRTKAVRDYGGAEAGMPAAMTGIENAIDEAAGVTRCVKRP